MDLFIEEKLLSIHHKLFVRDAQGNDVYEISSKPVSIGRKIHVADMQGNDLLYIHEKVPAITPKYWIEKDGQQIAELKGKIGIHKNFEIEGLGWHVDGSIFGHHYQVTDADGNTVLSVESEALTLADHYHVEIAEGIDPVVCVGIVAILDEVEGEKQGGEAVAIGDALSQ